MPPASGREIGLGQEALEQMETDLGFVSEVRSVVEFIRTAKRGIIR